MNAVVWARPRCPPHSPHSSNYNSYYHTACVEGNLAATGCYDGAVRLWSIRTLNCLRELRAHSGVVYSVRIQKGILASGSGDATIKLWSLLHEAECFATLDAPGWVVGLAFSPHGSLASICLSGQGALHSPAAACAENVTVDGALCRPRVTPHVPSTFASVGSGLI